MIEIKETDIIYKLDKNVCDLTDVKIPQEATVFDASDCENFSNLDELKNYKNLRVLLLSRTGIQGRDLKNIPDFIEAVDIRRCQNLYNYSYLPQRKDNPLYVLLSFAGERILNTIPNNVDIEIEGWVNTIIKRKSDYVFNPQNTRV